MCARTKLGLPFVCTQYMQLIVQGIIARVQRDFKVTLCHMVWMGNHMHMMIVAKDATQSKRFYGEIQKQLTESVKRLLGVPKLSLWDSNKTSVIHYGDAAGVIERIAYLYANPARAHLVDTISSYPGVSSWKAFTSVEERVSAKSSESCPWIRSRMIEKLRCRAVSREQDQFLVERLLREATEEHELILEPNAWMAAFGLRDCHVGEVNKQIYRRLQEFEAEARTLRTAKGFRVKGAGRLSTEELRMDYLPSKTSGKIAVYAKDPEMRCQMIREYEAFVEQCRHCYERWRLGDFSVEWPPGAMLPPAPQQMNWIEG